MVRKILNIIKFICLLPIAIGLTLCTFSASILLGILAFPFFLFLSIFTEDSIKAIYKFLIFDFGVFPLYILEE